MTDYRLEGEVAPNINISKIKEIKEIPINNALEINTLLTGRWVFLGINNNSCLLGRY